MSAGVNAGKRIRIDIDGYSGPAGFSEKDGKASLSFPSASKALQEGTVIEADGRDWTIHKITASPFLRGYRVVDLIPSTEA